MREGRAAQRRSERLPGERGRRSAPAGVGRLRVAVAAYEAGYHVMDVVEVDGGEPSAQQWGRLLGSAVVTDAQVLFVYGVPDAVRRKVDDMADELRMLVRVVSPPGHGPSAGA